jgi:hypothetical protein
MHGVVLCLVWLRLGPASDGIQKGGNGRQGLPDLKQPWKSDKGAKITFISVLYVSAPSQALALALADTENQDRMRRNPQQTQCYL